VIVAESSAPVVLRMRGLRKSFGAVKALDGVNLEVRAGEVHALIGENGAGKSTLMKVLSGAIAADAGEMVLFGPIPADASEMKLFGSMPVHANEEEWPGQLYQPTGPIDARDRGIAMIYQELNLAPHLTVEENIWLGREVTRWGWKSRQQMRPAVVQALARLEHPDISPETLVSELGPGARQLVEVARALVGQARVLVMDEPTSSLSRHDTERLFKVVDSLRADGVAIIYISHFLEEVEEIGDRYTVLRDGQTVGTGKIGEVALERIIEMMVGRPVDEIYPKSDSAVAVSIGSGSGSGRQLGSGYTYGDIVLEAENLAGVHLPKGVSLQLRRGEVLGIAGLVGAGRTEFLRALYGLDPVISGQVKISGPHRIGLLSEDRKEEGLAQGLSIAENLTMSELHPLLRWGWLSHRKRAEQSQRWVDELGVRCADTAQMVQNLSGGNQQKVAFARLLHEQADILLLDEPTRGVDVGSKVEIYRLMNRLAAEGKALLVVSSYLPELLGVCDRIAVMHRGRLGPAIPVAECTEKSLLDQATRGHEPVPAKG
jgi:ribose transport system ATP-binding protein